MTDLSHRCEQASADHIVEIWASVVEAQLEQALLEGVRAGLEAAAKVADAFTSHHRLGMRCMKDAAEKQKCETMAHISASITQAIRSIDPETLK